MEKNISFDKDSSIKHTESVKEAKGESEIINFV